MKFPTAAPTQSSWGSGAGLGLLWLECEFAWKEAGGQSGRPPLSPPHTHRHAHAHTHVQSHIHV